MVMRTESELWLKMNKDELHNYYEQYKHIYVKEN